MWMLYWCVDGKEGGEDEGEALSFLVDLHSWYEDFESVLWLCILQIHNAAKNS